MHAPHTPLLHTMLVPHDVPLGLSPVIPQTIAPVVHTFAPVLHWFVGWQLVPDVQAVQAPALHTMLRPHDRPLVLLVVSVHVMPPVAHEVVPFLHGFVGWQVIPAVQPPHAPLLHT